MDPHADYSVMTLFLADRALVERKRALRRVDALGGLAQSLQHELHAALDVPVPGGKARLTRHGGRCATCTVLLRFDPREPYAHRCPRCDTVYTDAVHHDWWLMNAHLWTAEQCTRAAAIAFFRDDAAAAARADQILATYSDRYLNWPNRDNALGPTRPFFSTYLESIWLLHLATALDLRIAAVGVMTAHHNDVCERLIAPSAALIAGFDERRSNRQVWHVAALLAAATLLGDRPMHTGAVTSLQSLLRTGLHADGSWYEGENYHLFAHRGLLTAVTLAEQAQASFDPALMTRFEAGFVAPFRTALPDGTFPARRDSQYGVSLRQWRTADWVECGFARRDTPQLRAALASLYATGAATGDTGRWNSSADAERNQPAVQLARADCSWRALLLARIDLPPLADATPRSELLEGQGVAVFRRQRGQWWVGLDYGDPGAGHGHADRLNLIIATPQARWLDDVGTGSYTSPTLPWYRSSMSHNAPMVDGQDQGAAFGALLAYDERGEAGWVSAVFVDPVSGVRIVRTLVVMSDYVLDEVTWSASHEVMVDLPMQAIAHGDALRWSAFTPGTAYDAELDDPASAAVFAGRSVPLVMRGLPSPALRNVPPSACFFECHLLSAASGSLWRARTMGAPASAPHGLTALRQRGTSGRALLVYAATAVIGAVTLEGQAVSVQRLSGGADLHRRVHAGWQIAPASAPEQAPITLAGMLTEPYMSKLDAQTHSGAARRLVPLSDVKQIALGEREYRQTEASWREAGKPRATVRVWTKPRKRLSKVIVEVSVELNRAPSFAAPVDENPLDNESPDVNSDGVQLHWRSAITGEWNSVLAIPDGSTVRLTMEDGTLDGLSAAWRQVDTGYLVTLSLPWPDLAHQFEFDCIVNERPPGRERRRGQLVLSGAHGESAYLRGARQSSDRALHVTFVPPSGTL